MPGEADNESVAQENRQIGEWLRDLARLYAIERVTGPDGHPAVRFLLNRKEAKALAMLLRTGAADALFDPQDMTAGEMVGLGELLEDAVSDMPED